MFGRVGIEPKIPVRAHLWFSSDLFVFRMYKMICLPLFFQKNEGQQSPCLSSSAALHSLHGIGVVVAVSRFWKSSVCSGSGFYSQCNGSSGSGFENVEAVQTSVLLLGIILVCYRITLCVHGTIFPFFFKEKIWKNFWLHFIPLTWRLPMSAYAILWELCKWFCAKEALSPPPLRSMAFGCDTGYARG